MWINLDDNDFKLVLEALRGNCSDKPDEPTAYDPIYDRLQACHSDFDPADPYREAAREHWSDEGGCEIDDSAVVSHGDDPGAYVMAWVWVTERQAGMFTCEECSGVFTLDREAGDCVCDECAPDDENKCRDCGEEYADGGDGYNGRCPDCADKAEEEGCSDD
ncbi:hypothetical protein GFL39_26205 [Rhizobium leguminosarum bv. viciae]|uniref:hypothetical protein n=1 Tax=Rhizobium leguminosarum TaxID=384 RepID=UPI001441097B|nr:hypothetical protein [Rhizobium leguminosarum]NKL08365.1 hypothetical protein [Rhizobium leguminosarum bv. viciae]